MVGLPHGLHAIGKKKKGRTNSDINPVISIKCVAAPNQQAIYILVIFFFNELIRNMTNDKVNVLIMKLVLTSSQ